MKVYIKHLLIIGCVIGLISCGAQKNDYGMDDMDLPEEFVLSDSIARNLDSLLIPREKFFTDDVLVELIESAFENNFAIRSTNKEIEINDELYKYSKAAFYPQLNLNLLTIERRYYSKNSRLTASGAYYNHYEKEAPENLFLERSDFYSGPVLNWELGLWGKLRKQKQAAAALYERSSLAKRAIQTEVIASIAEDYYTILMLDEQIDVAQKNHKFRDSTLTMINLLYNAGEVSALAVQQAQTQVLDASSLIVRLEEEREIRENYLRLLAGKLPGDIRRNFRMEVEDSIYEEVKELPLYLVQNRPDVLMAQYGLTAANAKAGVAQVQRYPNINITLQGGVESLLPQNWFNIPGSLFGSLIGGVTAPVFQGRKLKTAYHISMLERDKAEIDFQRKVYEAIVDIKNSLASLKGLEDQLYIANVKQLVAQQALENSRMLFQSGFANYLEVITAQSEAMQAELDLVRVKANLLAQRVQLFRALGGGWQ